MKVGDWKMLPLAARKGRTRRDKVKVDSMVAIHEGERVILHRVEKKRQDGTTEVFIIKASARDLKTDH